MKLNAQQKAYLRSIGLAEDATDAQVRQFVEGLTAEQRSKLEGLAAPGSGGGDGGGSDAGSGGSADSGRASGEHGGGASGGGDEPGVGASAGGRDRGAADGEGSPSGRASGDESLSLVPRSQIQAAARMAGLEGEAADEFVAEQSLAATSIADVRRAALEAYRSRRGPTRQHVQVGDDGRASMYAGMRDSVFARCGVAAEQPHARASEFEGLTLIEIGRQWLAQIGVSDAYRMHREDVATMMINHQALAGRIGATAFGHTTSDFPSILSTTTNRILVAGYDDVMPTWSTWCRTRQVNNLNWQEMVQPGVIGRPQQVLEGAEYTMGYIGEKKERVRALKYGLRTAITLEMLINDDLGAFSDSVFDFGGSTAELDEYLVYTELTGNPTMQEDSTAMFHADHGNLASGTGNVGAPSIDLISAGRVAMATQTGIAPKSGETGRKIGNNRPAFILVPEALADDTDQLVSSLVDPGKSNNTPNQRIVRELTPVASSYLDDNSSTAWYLTARRSRSPIVKAVLRGFERPTVLRTPQTSPDAVWYYLRYFTGAGAAEWRTGYKNPGA